VVIVSLIILLFVITGFLYTKSYKREEISTLNKKQNPFILMYSLSYKIIDQLKISNSIKTSEYLDYAKKISIVIFMFSITSLLCYLKLLISKKVLLTIMS